jgi:hypothetical protein
MAFNSAKALPDYYFLCYLGDGSSHEHGLLVRISFDLTQCVNPMD